MVFLRIPTLPNLPVNAGIDIFPVIIVSIRILIFGVAIYTGLYLGKEIGFGAPLLEQWQDGRDGPLSAISVIRISVFFGILVAIGKTILDRFIFGSFVPPIMEQWKEVPLLLRAVIPFEQGIGVEIIARLFWMTILVWIFYKIQKPENNQPTSVGVWIPIIIIAILSTSGTLFWNSDTLVKIQAVVLTAIGGIVYGWLYWKKGIESAIIAHFSSGVLLVIISLV